MLGTGRYKERRTCCQLFPHLWRFFLLYLLLHGSHLPAKPGTAMSPTNIRHASDLLTRAGRSFDDQATIQPFGKQVYTIYTDTFPQEVLNQYASLFNHGVEGKWLSYQNDTTKLFKIVQPSPPMGIPKLMISCALAEDPLPNHSKAPNRQPKEPLDFLLIVQGSTGSDRSKLVVARGRTEAATTMLHEAMNGFSTVFTGALLRSDMNLLFHGGGKVGFSLRKCQDVADLNTSSKDRREDEHVLGVIC